MQILKPFRGSPSPTASCPTPAAASEEANSPSRSTGSAPKAYAGRQEKAATHPTYLGPAREHALSLPSLLLHLQQVTPSLLSACLFPGYWEPYNVSIISP